MGSAVTSLQIREANLDLEVLRANLLPKQRHMITEDTVQELEKLANDPDYGDEFLDSYKDHLNILSTNSKYTSRGYLSALKFFSLMEAGNKITNAYIKVFPERLKARIDRGQGKKDIRGEASRYNATALVNEIRKVAGMPVQLIHRNLLHEAILAQGKLMRTAKSELVRQKAGEALIKELKPLEENVISIQVEDGAKSAIEQLRQATELLAIQESQSAKAGIPLKTIVEAKIIHKEIEEDIEEAEFTEVEEVQPTTEWKF
jgi:hypothetical protein